MDGNQSNESVESEAIAPASKTPDYSKGLLIDYNPQQSQSVGDWGGVKYDSSWDDGSAFPEVSKKANS